MKAGALKAKLYLFCKCMCMCAYTCVCAREYGCPRGPDEGRCELPNVVLGTELRSSARAVKCF